MGWQEPRENHPGWKLSPAPDTALAPVQSGCVQAEQLCWKESVGRQQAEQGVFSGSKDPQQREPI